MNTDTLLKIVETRMHVDGDNPTKASFLYEVVKALERLKTLEAAQPREEDDKDDDDTWDL